MMTHSLFEIEPKCASADDPDIFYSYDNKDISKAKSICAECPLRKQCLTGALNSGERWGVWGGASQNELRATQSIDINGDAKDYGVGFPTRCLYCGPRTTKYLYTVEKKRTGTRIACSQCGLEWFTKKIINKNQTNF